MMMVWQPIETAPKDHFLLLCGPSGYTTTPLVFTTGRMCSDYHAGRWIDHANDDLSDWGFEPTHWMPLPDPPGAQAQPAQKAVAYLDLGVGGYMDIGTDLTDKELDAIPKGRHMLGIVGTYGVDGYVPAQPATIEMSITTGALSEMFLRLNGHDKAQPGYEWRKGWNDAIRQAMDYAQPAPSVKDAIIDDLRSQFDSEGITEHDSGDALIRLSDAIAAVEDNFVQPAPSVPDGWLRAIDEALVVAHIGVANAEDTYEQAGAKLNSLIGFHVDVATDPAVNGGWKLMPIEPTKEIYECFAAYDGTSYSNPFDFDDFVVDYAFAIEAAPEAKP